MITLRKVTLQRGARRLLEAVDLTIVPRQKIGLTGANGTGKSSLLACCAANSTPKAGDVDIQPGLRMAHVAQETPSSPAPAIEYALDGHVELRADRARAPGGRAGARPRAPGGAARRVRADRRLQRTRRRCPASWPLGLL